VFNLLTVLSSSMLNHVGTPGHEEEAVALVERRESTMSQAAFSKEQGVFAGALLADQPSYCTSPPIEVVVFGWGVTEDGQLGLDSLEDVTKPSVLESLLGTSFSGFRYNRKPIVAGSRHTLAVTDDGRILAWGWNDRGSLGLGHR
jgi:hypothetical protein